MIRRSRGWVWLSVAWLAACGASGPAVKKPAPEPEVRGAEGIGIQFGGGEEESSTTPTGEETAAGERASDEPTAAGADRETEAPAAEESDPGVRLIDAGRGARRALRYRPTTGAAQTRIAELEWDASMDMGGTNHSFPTTRLRTRGESQVSAVGGTGDIEFTHELTDVQSLDGPAEAAGYLEPLKGQRTTRTISHRGVTLKSDSATSRMGRGDVERLVDRLTGLTGAPPALPAESIGVGARWEEQDRIDIQGLVVEIATTSELHSLEGDRATIRYSSSATVDAHALNQGGVSFKDILLSDRGEYEVTLTKLVPEKMTRELHVEATMATGAGGDAALKMTLRVDARTQ